MFLRFVDMRLGWVVGDIADDQLELFGHRLELACLRFIVAV